MIRLSSILLICLSSFIAFAQDSTSTPKKLDVKIGGALRFNYNNSSWKPNQRKRGGDFGFETFRINVDATYGDWEIHADQRIYAQDFGGTFLKYGWFQYNIDSTQHLKVGLIPAYFGAKQFNSHSWFFQLPFYIGFEDDHDMGLSYSISKPKFDLDIGYYKNAEEYAFSDNSSISDSRYAYDFSGDNRETHQANIRFNYKIKGNANHLIGLSQQYGGIWNNNTQAFGSQAAIGVHYDATFKRFNIKAQALRYQNVVNDTAGANTDIIEMTAYGFPYNTAASGAIYSIGISYDFPIKKGPISSIQLYNDYSYMAKDVASFEATEMNVLGALVSADPFYAYVDYAMGKHQPWLGPQWTNALASGDASNSWESRFNINFGFYF